MKIKDIKIGMKVGLPFNEEGVVINVPERFLWMSNVKVQITKSTSFNILNDIVDFHPRQLKELESRDEEEEKEVPWELIVNKLKQSNTKVKTLTLREEIELDRLKGDLLIYKTKLVVEGTMGRTFAQSIKVNKEIVRVLQNRIKEIEG